MPLADDQTERLAALRASGLLEPTEEPEFERFSRLAARTLGAEKVSLSLVDDERQVFKTAVGVDFREVPLSHSFSRHVVEAGTTVRIDDAREDPRTCESPAIEELGVMAFLGVPVRDSRGHVLGALAAIESVPRHWTDEDAAALADIAATVETELRLRAERTEAVRQRALAASVNDVALDAIFVMAADGNTVDLNAAASELFGYSRADAVGRPLAEQIIPPTQRAAHVAGLERLHAAGEAGILDRRILIDAMRSDGSELPVELAVTRTQAAGECRYVVYVRDLSGVQEAQRARDAAEQQVALVVDAAPVALFAVDLDGMITVSVGSALQAFGVGSGDLVGQSVFDLFGAGPGLLDLFRRVLAGEHVTSLHERDGVALESRLRPLTGPDGVRGVVGVSLDVTERRQAEARIEELAYGDPLTGLGNKALLAQGADRELARCAAEGESAALLFIDLDDFRTVNDSLGHSVGDQVLREAAARLTAVVGDRGLLARQGADEFLLLLTDLGPEPQEPAEAVARRLLAALETPFTVDGLEFAVRAGIGVSLFPRDGSGFEELLRHADVAMYRAKRSGHGRHEVYRPEVEDARHRLTLPTRLRRALDRGEFVLDYQPLFELASDRPAAVEGLLRWHDPEHGVVAPLDFIPAAEASGLIIEIGAWVAEAACRQAVAWRAMGHPIGVGFNVSPRQLGGGRFAAILSSVLATTGADPAQMVVEVTESAAMADSASIIEELRLVAALGVQVVVDDFGAGHSSLTRLRQLPVHALKIDRALLQGYPDDAAARAVVGATFALAEALEMSTVAEGIEHESQLVSLAALGCTYGQGFGLARPMPAAEITPLLARRRANLTPGFPGRVA